MKTSWNRPRSCGLALLMLWLAVAGAALAAPREATSREGEAIAFGDGPTPLRPAAEEAIAAYLQRTWFTLRALDGRLVFHDCPDRIAGNRHVSQLADVAATYGTTDFVTAVHYDFAAVITALHMSIPIETINRAWAEYATPHVTEAMLGPDLGRIIKAPAPDPQACPGRCPSLPGVCGADRCCSCRTYDAQAEDCFAPASTCNTDEPKSEPVN